MKIGKHRISEQEFYDRIFQSLTAKQFDDLTKKVARIINKIFEDQFEREFKKLEKHLAGILMAHIPRKQVTCIIAKIQKDLDKEKS
jgi:hypothetical protein